MRLNPKEQEKLMLHMAGNLAKERKERGLKLNYVCLLYTSTAEMVIVVRFSVFSTSFSCSLSTL